ncbi:putative exocyst complex component Exo70, cullin repeat-like-containing domain superfamily [Helianthus anomalus]
MRRQVDDGRSILDKRKGAREARAKRKQYAGNYERIAWSKVITSLPTNTTVENLPIESARDCFRRFNLEFNGAYRKQSMWIILDSKLRDDIKISLSKRILPTYRTLYERYRWCFQGVDSVVKYAPDDLGNYLSDFFTLPELREVLMHLRIRLQAPYRVAVETVQGVLEIFIFLLIGL